MQMLEIMPAQSSSRQVPNKNLTLLKSHTLMRRALKTYLAARQLATIALTSNAPAILAKTDSLDHVLVLERPKKLANDTALTYDVTIHTLGAAQTHAVTPFDAVTIVQCTSPFTLPKNIDQTIELLKRSRAKS